MASDQPEYLICLECETPCYTFEFAKGKLKEAMCMVCANDDIDTFASEEEFDALGTAGH
jgi:hypothetical protein